MRRFHVPVTHPCHIEKSIKRNEHYCSSINIGEECTPIRTSTMVTFQIKNATSAAITAAMVDSPSLFPVRYSFYCKENSSSQLLSCSNVQIIMVVTRDFKRGGGGGCCEFSTPQWKIHFSSLTEIASRFLDPFSSRWFRNIMSAPKLFVTYILYYYCHFRFTSCTKEINVWYGMHSLFCHWVVLERYKKNLECSKLWSKSEKKKSKNQNLNTCII